LKSAFTTTPVLAHFHHEKPTRIETDASKYALGAILSQKQDDNHWHPVAYLSRKFNSAETRYSTFDQEMCAIIAAITEWRHFILSAKQTIPIIIDHRNLTFFGSLKAVSDRHARWIDTISRYNIELVYRLGSRNPADAPSRRLDYIHDSAEHETYPWLTLYRHCASCQTGEPLASPRTSTNRTIDTSNRIDLLVANESLIALLPKITNQLDSARSITLDFL
jgi:hypothetical protein